MRAEQKGKDAIPEGMGSATLGGAMAQLSLGEAWEYGRVVLGFWSAVVDYPRSYFWELHHDDVKVPIFALG